MFVRELWVDDYVDDFGKVIGWINSGDSFWVINIGDVGVKMVLCELVDKWCKR